MLTYYEILGCDKNASYEEIKKCYQEQVKKCHPDKSEGKSNLEFFALDKAWKTLRNPETRREYDLEIGKNYVDETPLYCEVELSEMCHDSNSNTYCYTCRCGGLYSLNKNELSGVERLKVPCDHCTFHIDIFTDSKKVPSASRIYSPARMKRRANINRKKYITDLGNMLPSDKNAKHLEPVFESNKSKVHFKKTSNVENIEPKRLKITQESNENRKLNTQNLKTSSNLKKLPEAYSSAEHGFLSRSSLLEKLSDSTIESNDSLVPLVTNFLQDQKSQTLGAKEIEKIKILATLLPDEILKDPRTRKPRLYETALMFPDVSGFTQLCEKFDKTGMGGPSRLTEVLNGYIGFMINIVLSKSGDVCKFGGDAFLCAWKASDSLDLSEVVHLAIESAIEIQKFCGEHKTDVGVKLRVKIAVSAGKAIFSIIGTKTKKHYVIAGPPVTEVRDAEQMCKAGDVIVTPSAWKHVKNYMLYSFTFSSNNKYVKVNDFGPLWKSAAIPLKVKGKDLLFGNTRPILKYAAHLEIEDVRPFILPPVMKSIDLNRPLDYLTEMRQVAIVFFNITSDFSSMPSEEIVSLSNKTFQIISEFVYKAGGATNKLTLFDKDLAVLTVFGLKGFKHELASQEALKCAYNALEQLKKLEVTSVSGGVTTGMTYCGVIGHPLRKEYTVMGHPVNMAARLMCAYQNIVSCDRNTFLHSKLDSNHFEVLGHEYLKGIQSAGPFYKFNLHPKRAKLKLDHEAYPLLGRKQEVKEFELFLKNGMKPNNQVNFMIIYGKARIGKSRLVARLINIAEKLNVEESTTDLVAIKAEHLKICVIPLTEDDSKVSFLTSRLIFQYFLGFNESSSKEEREDKILQKLGEIKDFSSLASINPIFNVSFALSPQYLAFSISEQIDAQIYLVKELYKKCSQKGDKWLIVIEDAEFIDDESWNLLKWCSNESDKVLYLLTIGQKRNLTPTAMDCLERIKAKRITLAEIDKWYYSGLACQILGVKAIPVELENLLQRYKSSGNPGWLESFLLSLLQGEYIHIIQSSVQNLKTLGLVAPPNFMLKSTRETDSEELVGSEWAECLETFESVAKKDVSDLRVCVLGRNFRTGNESEAELTMDAMFIKTIDTLKPLQQLVLKAGSVLGNNLKRNALQFVISKDTPVDERQFAKAIKNLFEIKIFTCAKGSGTETNLLLPRRMVLISSIRKEIICECTGLDIPESCKNLPKYACCGFMQFRSPIFRDTVYNLLLDDQKKKFHSSCIEFLRKNTFKCNTCRNLPFTNILGYDDKDEVLPACTVTPMHGIRSTKLEPKSRHPFPSLGSRLVRCAIGNLVSEVRHSFIDLGNTLGLFFAGEKSDCQCSDILSSVYLVLLEHATGSGRKDIMLEVQLEYASVSLTAHNIPLTTQILEDALVLVNQVKEDKTYPELCTPYIYGKIYTLMGATKLSMGRLKESLELLKNSLQYMKKRFPSNNCMVKVLINNEAAKLKLITECFPQELIGKTTDKKAPFKDLLCECLGLISIAHMYMENWLLAKYASLRALNKGLESNRNFFGLCIAYTTMINVAFIRNDLKTCAKLEICAIGVCRRCSGKSIEVYEWEAICRLCSVIFQSRHARAEIEEAAVIGFQSVKIASAIRNTNVKLNLIPDLIFALVQLNRLSEAVALIQELEFMSQLDSDKSSRLWYYAICLDFQLYTGFTVVPYETCENFVKEEDDRLVIRDPEAKYRLFTSLWLWCVRNNEWELSKAYGRTLENFNLSELRKIPVNIFTRLERLEGFLITLVHKMDQRNIYSINAIYGEIHAYMKRLEKDVKTIKLFRPRYQVLKSYYRQIRYRDESYNRLLNQAQSLAEKIKDINVYQWIVHLKMVWSNAISPIQRDYWVEHSRRNNLEWHETDSISKKLNIMYSLPLPKF